MELIECISKLWTSELKFSKYKLPALRRFWKVTSIDTSYVTLPVTRVEYYHSV
jgi:hypothetical protein